MTLGCLFLAWPAIAAADASGNVDTCTVLLTVSDDEVPRIAQSTCANITRASPLPTLLQVYTATAHRGL